MVEDLGTDDVASATIPVAETELVTMSEGAGVTKIPKSMPT